MKPNQLSQTAAFIAIKFYGLTKDEPYRRLFDEQTIAFYDKLVKGLPAPLNKYHKMLDKKWLRSFFQWSEELLLPGDLMHILMRKYYITKMIESLKNEYSQMLVLGSGFDHLGAIYSAKGLCCLEVDAPYMARLKANFLNKHEYHNKDLYIESAHLITEPLAALLKKQPDFSPSKKTIVIAEGFFDYMPHKQVRQVLTDVIDFFEANVSLISTAFALEELPAFRRFVFKSGVRMVGETLLLDHSLKDFTELLKDQQFNIKSTISGKLMKEKTLEPEKISLPILDGFYLIHSHFH